MSTPPTASPASARPRLTASYAAAIKAERFKTTEHLYSAAFKNGFNGHIDRCVSGKPSVVNAPYQAGTAEFDAHYAGADDAQREVLDYELRINRQVPA